MNSKKSLPQEKLSVVLTNMANYIECILMENLSLNWGPFLAQAEIFFRRILLIMSSFDSFSPFFKNIISILRIPGVVLFKVKYFSWRKKLIKVTIGRIFSFLKNLIRTLMVSSYNIKIWITFLQGILDPFSKILSYSIENFPLNYRSLLEVCFHCNRAYTRVRIISFLHILPSINNLLLTKWKFLGAREIYANSSCDFWAHARIKIKDSSIRIQLFHFNQFRVTSKLFFQYRVQHCIVNNYSIQNSLSGYRRHSP